MTHLEHEVDRSTHKAKLCPKEMDAELCGDLPVGDQKQTKH